MTAGADKRPFWQFSLKTILLLTALVALAIGWWRDHVNLTRQLDEAKRKIQFLETSHYFDGGTTLEMPQR